MIERRRFLKRGLSLWAAAASGCGSRRIFAAGSKNRQAQHRAAAACPPVPHAETREAEFPLRRERGKPYLLDAAGKPFLLQGDAAWSLMVQLNREEAEAYLEDRRQRRFNAVLVNLIEHAYAEMPPYNRYGHAPFVTQGHYTDPDDRYFEHVDWVLNTAAAKGILVMLAPSYLGCCGDGWYDEMSRNGSAAMRSFGRYLGQRYQCFRNILWVHGGDGNPSNRRLVSEIAIGIRESDRNSLHTAHTHWEQMAADVWGGSEWLAVNNLYTYKPVYLLARQAQARADRMPFFLMESCYENERDAPVARVRAQAWHAMLSGATGHVMGNNPVWHFNSPSPPYPAPLQRWEQALDSEAARSMTQLNALFSAYPWWRLEPDTGAALLSGGLADGFERALAARAADGAFAFAYLPSRRTVAIRPGRLAGPHVAVRWLDPVDGSFHDGGSIAAASPIAELAPPEGSNSAGSDDWVLVLDSRK